MTATRFAVPAVGVDRLPEALGERGFAVLGPADFAAFAGTTPAGLDALRGAWDDLPADLYLKDGGRYRRRRHVSFVVSPDGAIEPAARRAHWQPLEYNALHGGLERWFEPVAAAIEADPAWRAVLVSFAALASRLSGVQTWYGEAHQFRIDTTGGIGRPTPEGAHRDGVDWVAVVLVARHAVKGGETRVFDADGPSGTRFTLLEPWSALFLDDARVVHETTPIQPLGNAPGHRDTLVVTLRAGGFQGPTAVPPASRR